MWNQTALLLNRVKDLPDRSGDGLLAAIRDVIDDDSVLAHVYRPDAVSFWRAVQARVWRGRPDPIPDARARYRAGAIAHIVTMLRAQDEGWRTWFAEETSSRSRSSIRCCGATLLRCGHRLGGVEARPATGTETGARTADQRSDEWVDRYRADAERMATDMAAAVAPASARRVDEYTGAGGRRLCTSSAKSWPSWRAAVFGR
jgi:trehalose 2-sulfotransferase